MDNELKSYTVRLTEDEYEAIAAQFPKLEREWMILTLALLQGNGFNTPKLPNTWELRNWLRKRSSTSRQGHKGKYSPTRRKVLTLIQGVGPITTKRVSDDLGIKYQQAYRTLERLCADGYLVKTDKEYDIV